MDQVSPPQPSCTPRPVNCNFQSTGHLNDATSTARLNQALQDARDALVVITTPSRVVSTPSGDGNDTTGKMRQWKQLSQNLFLQKLTQMNIAHQLATRVRRRWWGHLPLLRKSLQLILRVSHRSWIMMTMMIGGTYFH